MNVFKCYVLKVKDIFSKTPLGLSADTYGYRNSLLLFYIFLFMYYNAYLQWRLILMYFTFRSWYRSWMLNLLTPVVRSSRLVWSLTSDSLFFLFSNIEKRFRTVLSRSLTVIWQIKSSYHSESTLMSEKGPAEKRNFGRKQGSCEKRRGWARPGFTLLLLWMTLILILLIVATMFYTINQSFD